MEMWKIRPIGLRGILGHLFKLGKKTVVGSFRTLLLYSPCKQVQLGFFVSIWKMLGRRRIVSLPGFGMLESGCVSKKNEVNIMMKNVVDISLGGLTYWLFGFGMSFGLNEPTNSFVGSGGYLLSTDVDDELMGEISSSFIFQLSFATTSTTIVSGAMAER